MLAQLLGLVLGVQDGQLGEHTHVHALETQTGLQQRHELHEVPAAEVVGDQLIQLVGLHHNVETADLRKAELACVNAREAHLAPAARVVGLACSLHGILVLACL